MISFILGTYDKFIETENKKVVSGDWIERGIESCYLTGVDASLTRRKEFCKMGGDDGYTKI